MRNGKIHIGTSGWSYRNWPEFFYPAGTKSADWLTHYATVFDTTEVNSSFYRLPMQKTVNNWVAKVPEGFKFCVKVSKYLTHIKKLKEPEEPLERFFGIFGPVKERLGPVLIQLPASLQFDAPVAEHFFSLLSTEYSQYDFVLEVRHKTWMEQEVIDLMTAHKIGFVISQSGVGFPYAEHITSKNIYVRFHGPEQLYASSYTDDMLAEYAAKFKVWIKKGYTVWAYFNNTMYEHGVNNAMTLKQLVSSKK
jgi:uncharacterized protein YecE (DUF72 family)